MITITVLIGSGIGAIVGALLGVTMHLVGRVKQLEREAHDHPMVPMPSPAFQRLELRVEAQARYLRHCMVVAEYTATRLDGRVDDQGQRIAKLDRAGHRHEEQRRT